MFEINELKKVIELHDKSYQLFLWINNKLKNFGSKSKKHTLFDTVHDNLNFCKCSLAWIEKHYNEIPNDFRPNKEDREAFAHLLTSYLTTSFEKSDKIRVSDGCPCPFCTFFINVKAFKLRNPNKKAKEEAQRLKARYIENLFQETDIHQIPSNIEEWISKYPELDKKISLATYGRELIRRSKFTSQGVGILVLWREIAWKDNHLDRNFKLSVKAIIEAESEILEKLKNR